MGISILGLLFTDFNFIMVTLNSKRVPGGYWFLVVGPVVEGILGGLCYGHSICSVADVTGQE